MCALENLKPPRYMATRLPNQMGPYNVRVLFWKVVWCKSYLANECQPWRLPGQPSTWKAEPNRCTHWPISRIIPGPLLYKQCVCNWFMRCSHPLSCETRPNDFFYFCPDVGTLRSLQPHSESLLDVTPGTTFDLDFAPACLSAATSGCRVWNQHHGTIIHISIHAHRGSRIGIVGGLNCEYPMQKRPWC